MERPVTAFLVIIAAALLLQVAYHFATVGMLGGGDTQYPTAHELAREAGLLLRPAARPAAPPAPVAAASALLASPAVMAPAVKALPHKRRPRPPPPAGDLVADRGPPDTVPSPAAGATDTPPF